MAQCLDPSPVALSTLMEICLRRTIALKELAPEIIPTFMRQMEDVVMFISEMDLSQTRSP